jgi:hypothetical protein
MSLHCTYQGTNIYYLGISSVDKYGLDKAGNDTIEGEHSSDM